MKMKQTKTKNETEEENTKMLQVDEVEEVEFDEFLSRHVGEMSYFQIVLFTVLIVDNIMSACVALGPVFVAAIPDHHCDVSYLNASRDCTLEKREELLLARDEDGAYSRCEFYDYSNTSAHAGCLHVGNGTHARTRQCSHWSYDKSTYQSTITTEWDLVCSRLWWTSNVQAVFWIGKMIGLVLFGYLADRFGRWKPIVGATVCFYILMIAMTAATNYWFYLVAKLLMAAVFSGRTTIVIIACIELMGIKWRVIGYAVAGSAFGAGYWTMAAFAYFIRNWRPLQAAMTLPDVFVFLMFLVLMPESPRWLLARGRRAEALAILKRITRINRRPWPRHVLPTVKERLAENSMWTLMKWPATRVTTLIQCLQWFSVAFIYYGLSMNTDALGGNNYVNFSISGVCDVIASILIPALIRIFGRTRSLGWSMLLAGVLDILSLALPKHLHIALIITGMTGKFFISIAFGILWMYSLEVFPTCIRSVGVSTLSTVGRIGSTAVAYHMQLAAIHASVPVVMVAVMTLLSGSLAFILPETRDQPLKQTVQEGERFMAEALPCFSKKTDGDQTRETNQNDVKV